MDEQQRPENPFRAKQQPRPNPAPQMMPQPAPRTAPVPRMAASPVVPVAPARAKKPGSPVVLWLGAAFGVFMLVSSAVDVRYSVVYALGGVLLGLAITLGFGWPLYCRRVDRKAVEAWEKEQTSNRELAALLTEEDAAIAQALAPQPRPEPKPRNWKKIGSALAVLVVLGSLLISAGDSAYKENNPDAVSSASS